MILNLPWKKLAGIVLGMLGLLGFGLFLATALSMPEPPVLPTAGRGKIAKQTFLDRHGRRLNITLQNQWNRTHQINLHDVPEFLVKAFITAEDKRFFSHHGVDWLARLDALRQNIFAGRAVRGASTITEQVARMIQPRPRTLWNRWLEGFNAMRLERAHTKLEILEFYLNQVPTAPTAAGLSRQRNIILIGPFPPSAPRKFWPWRFWCARPNGLIPGIILKTWNVPSTGWRLDCRRIQCHFWAGI